jgi:hypothetical protein
VQGLNEIDWPQPRGPFGRSAEIPDAIRDLWSEDAETRAYAVSLLQKNLWHQETVYEVTAPAWGTRRRRRPRRSSHPTARRLSRARYREVLDTVVGVTIDMPARDDRADS